MNKINKNDNIVINEPDDEIFDYLENNAIGNRVLNWDSSALDIAKYKLCSIISEIKNNCEFSDQDFAKSLAIDEYRAKLILFHHYDKFTFFELAVYLEKLALSQQTKVEQIEQQQYQTSI